MLGAGSIRLGGAEVVLGGGMENMSRAPFLLKEGRYGYRMGSGEPINQLIHDGLRDPYSCQHMGQIAEARVARHGLTREEQDKFAFGSYRKAQGAVEDGVFAGEIGLVVKGTRKGEVTVEKDEGPFKVDFAKLPALRAVFSKEGTITAGNASTINGLAALMPI